MTSTWVNGKKNKNVEWVFNNSITDVKKFIMVTSNKINFMVKDY